MKKVILAVLAALGFAGSAQAQVCWPCVTWEPRVVTTYRPKWHEENVPVMVDRWTSKEVVDKVKVKVLTPKWVDEKQVVVSYRYDPKVVQTDVVRCRWVPVCFIDPCTCCPYLTWQPQTFVVSVPCTTYEAKRMETVVPVKVCRMEWTTQVVENRRLEWENKPERVNTVRRYCTLEPHVTTVAVPVCLPCYSCCYPCFYFGCPW